MIVVTGGAGFIGSCIVARLNEIGRSDIIVVDDYRCTKQFSKKGIELKKKNLRNKSFVRFLDKDDFLNMVKNNELKEIDCILHMGACSSTTMHDKYYFEENNFLYTKVLAQWSVKNNVQFIYASSAATYGNGKNGYSDDSDSIRNACPLNLYGQSKQKFDIWSLDNDIHNKIVGLKFFNVFGPNEYHKEDMRSVIAKSYRNVVEKGKIAIFKSYNDDYSDGEQKRDFIYVKDVVDVILYFMDCLGIYGIFNVGTGQSRTWNDLSIALFKAVGSDPVIEYIDMPEDFRDRYQYFTEADVSRLRGVGYDKAFISLEEAIVDYVVYLKDSSYW